MQTRADLQWVTVVCVAVGCSALGCVAVRCSVLQCVAVCCSVLQCVAVCCSVLQCVSNCDSSSWSLDSPELKEPYTHKTLLQHTAIKMHHIATRCYTIYTATHCNTLQHTATHCKLKEPYTRVFDSQSSTLIIWFSIWISCWSLPANVWSQLSIYAAH